MATKTDQEKNIDQIADISSSTLMELITGVIAWAFIGELVLLFAFDAGAGDRVIMSVSWWLGAAVAIFWAIHIKNGLLRALGMSMGDAQGLLRFHAVVRYAVAAAGIGILYLGVVLFAGGDSLVYATAYVPGILTLKAGAYTQPLIHGIFERRHGES